nr:MAG TPA: putative tail component [Caudoviricetes sp.]
MTAGSEFRGMADRFRAAPDKAAGMVRAATTKAVVDTQRLARERAPVDTGYLRASIFTREGAQGATWWGEAQVGAEYAYWVENGTSTQAPQPYMRPAHEQVRPVFVQMIEQIGGRVL